MNLISDILSSIFFELGLALLWIGLLWIAWINPKAFARKPLKIIRIRICQAYRIIRKEMGRYNKPVTLLIIISVAILAAYPVGNVMQRVSDDFVEVATVWMPKPEFKIKSIIDFKWKNIGTEKKLREKTYKKYAHILKYEADGFKLSNSFIKEEVDDNKDRDEIKEKSRHYARKVHDRRAFGTHLETMRIYIEFVRVTQVCVMHFFLLAYTFLVLGVVIFARGPLLLCINRIEEFTSQTVSLILESDTTNKFILHILLAIGRNGLQFLKWIMLNGIYGFLIYYPFYAATLHDEKKLYLPILFIFIWLNITLAFISSRIIKNTTVKEIPLMSTIKLFGCGLLAMTICYLSAASWYGYRENFLEAAIVLGAPEFKQAAPNSLNFSSEGSIFSATQRPEAEVDDGKVQMRAFELSGSAVVNGGLLIAEDELVGSILFAPQSTTNNLSCQIVQVTYKRKSSQPHTELPKLVPVQDFEGIASDDGNKVFLTGSHERHYKKGDRRTDREFLIQADWDEEERELKITGLYRNFLEDIKETMNDLGMQFSITETRINTNVNVEGLAYNNGELYIGLRSPLVVQDNGEHSALILQVNAEELFSKDFNASFKPVLIPLGGQGIRALAWDSHTDRLLVLSGPTSDDKAETPILWSFNPTNSDLKEIHHFTSSELKLTDEDSEESLTPEGVSRLEDGRIIVLYDGEETGAAKISYLDYP